MALQGTFVVNDAAYSLFTALEYSWPSPATEFIKIIVAVR